MATTTSAKPVLSALKTPLSATYPSELQSPLVASTPTLVKREEGESTPITPPVAYLDFLKALSPVCMSPLTTSTSSRFSFVDRPALSSASSSTSISSAPSSKDTPAQADPVDKPVSPPASVTSRSNSFSSCDSQKRSKPEDDDDAKPLENEKEKDVKSTTPPTAPAQSPFVRPMSARTPRRLHIPQSPYSPAGVQSPPMSAHSVRSPYSATMSPRDWDWEKNKPPGSATSRAVSVRQVVTRTVTYSRTPVDATPPAQLDPAPKGKRRKIA